MNTVGDNAIRDDLSLMFTSSDVPSIREVSIDLRLKSIKFCKGEWSWSGRVRLRLSFSGAPSQWSLAQNHSRGCSILFRRLQSSSSSSSSSFSLQSIVLASIHDSNIFWLCVSLKALSDVLHTLIPQLLLPSYRTGTCSLEWVCARPGNGRACPLYLRTAWWFCSLAFPGAGFPSHIDFPIHHFTSLLLHHAYSYFTEEHFQDFGLLL